jgi:hypothetical protein
MLISSTLLSPTATLLKSSDAYMHPMSRESYPVLKNNAAIKEGEINLAALSLQSIIHDYMDRAQPPFPPQQ